MAGADPWELAVQFILLFASDTPCCLYQSGNGVDTVHASTTFPGLTEMTATHLICGGNLFLEIAIMPQRIIDYVTSTFCVLISVAASYTLAIV